ncbi:MAG: hypothetical protein ACOX7B_10775 [Christensenellales bacterium]|jgi:hypothetical protein
MNTIENWKLLMQRMQAEKNPVIVRLSQIHMGAFDDLKKQGHLVKMNQQPISEQLIDMDADERLELAGSVGGLLTKSEQKGITEAVFNIQSADEFPHCIFIHIAAVIEHLDIIEGVLSPDVKMNVVCNYTTSAGKDNPLGLILPVLETCFPWIAVKDNAYLQAGPDPEKPKIIPLQASSVIFAAEKTNEVGTMRTVFTGMLYKGTIHVRDTLNVTDVHGNVLTREGQVLLIVVDGKPTQLANAGQRIDELCLALEIPRGKYEGILLLDSFKTLNDRILHSQQNPLQRPTEATQPAQPEPANDPPDKPKSFLSLLFKKKH